MNKNISLAKKNAKSVAISLRNEYNLVTIYPGLIHYRPFRTYNGNKVRHILTKLGSKAPLPKMNREILVIDNSKGVKVFLIRDSKGYYFMERFSSIGTKIRIIH